MYAVYSVNPELGTRVDISFGSNLNTLDWNINNFIIYYVRIAFTVTTANGDKIEKTHLKCLINATRNGFFST